MSGGCFREREGGIRLKNRKQYPFGRRKKMNIDNTILLDFEKDNRKIVGPTCNKRNYLR